MNLQWNDYRTRKFVTNIGIITSNGPNGPNLMAAAWTYQISYNPSLIAVCISHNDSTSVNIMESKLFGVNLCAFDQSIVSSIAGGYSGKEVDKIQILKELGVKFYQAKRISVPMLAGAAMNAECELQNVVELGDHTMFTGKIVEIEIRDKEPLIYCDGKYWQLGDQIQKPDVPSLEQINDLVQKHSK